jgi:hypothetical protein
MLNISLLKMNKITHRFYIGSFFVLSIAATLYLAIIGYQYYSTSIEERFFLSQHITLKPSGTIGHGIGILGTLMMILGVAIYMIRKRIRSFTRLGGLKYWLEFHIFLCTLGPIFVLYHTAFKFGGIVVVSFWSMVAVVLSGVIGRFIYLQIPRSISGQELSGSDLNSMAIDIENKLKQEPIYNSGLLKEINSFLNPTSFTQLSFTSGLVFSITDRFKTRSLLNRLKSGLKSAGYDKSHIRQIIEIAKSKIVISRRIRLLRTMQKFFRYWHIFHLPFAIVMFAIMIVHVAVTITFGYKWIF